MDESLELNAAMSRVPRSVYYMLSYAFKSLRPDKRDRIAATSFEHIHNLFAAILEKGIAHLLQYGMHREYESHRDELPVLRGRVDMVGTIRNRMACHRLVSCEYDELAEDNLFNRIIKTAAQWLEKHPDVEPCYRSALRKELLFFSQVGTVTPGHIEWKSIRFRRENNNYRMLLGFCRFILEGLMPIRENGEYVFDSYVNDEQMSALYERFIRKYYEKEYPALTVRASKIKWALDDECDDMLPEMKSDEMLTYGKRTLIIDAKYYTKSIQNYYGGAPKQLSHNLYQIFSYVKNYAALNPPQEVAGMLLYAKTPQIADPDASDKMKGNLIRVRTLDLDADFADIEAGLADIARWLGVEKGELPPQERRRVKRVPDGEQGAAGW